MAQSIICSPSGGTKGLWLCFMAKLLLFCLAWLFSYHFVFFHFFFFFIFLIKFILWLKFSYRQKADRRHGWGPILRRPPRVLLGCTASSLSFKMISFWGLLSILSEMFIPQVCIGITFAFLKASVSHTQWGLSWLLIGKCSPFQHFFPLHSYFPPQHFPAVWHIAYIQEYLI